jgi:nitroreductase
MGNIINMDAITAITQRVSVAQLTGPGPNQEQLELLYQAAFRAPDHAWMRPWRYLTIKDKGLTDLGNIFVEAHGQINSELTEEQNEKIASKPQRAPVMIVAIAHIQQHQKVPALEQRLAVGAGIQNILTAAYALGLGAIWRTGDMATNKHVMKSLGLQDNEEILGFIYLGHINCKLKNPPVLDSSDYVKEWPFNE